MSISEVCRMFASSVRTIPTLRSGIRARLLASSEYPGRRTVPMLMSRNGVGTCWLTTRIISSGVTPLAASEATNESALVPTYTSNWFTVRFTASRSSARRAPISYTPPVTPPPPRTSAVRDRRGRRRGGFGPGDRSRLGFSSLTTVPMPASSIAGVRTATSPAAAPLPSPASAVCSPLMPRALIAALAVLALLAPAADAKTALQRKLGSLMAGAGRSSGAYVLDADTGKRLFSLRSTTRRTLASNTKLFTSAAVLGKLGPNRMLATTVVGTGGLASGGTWAGNLFLRGGGDPTFGDRHFNRGYGSAASVEALAARLRKAGIQRVTGHVYGDESLFDSLRGGPDSNWGASPWVGPLSALDFDHGFAPGGGFLSNPARTAAKRLDSALEAAGVTVKAKAGGKPAPDGSVMLAEVRSPSVARLLRLQNKPSDNFFAEMLLKGLPTYRGTGGPARTAGGAAAAAGRAAAPLPGPATTKGGTRVAMRFARGRGANPRRACGSGPGRGGQASPRSVARLLNAMRKRADFTAFYDSLPIAGRDGTLDNRMRHGTARGRCHAKTGTLTGVSALSGYCPTRSGHTVVFSILMNRVGVTGARRIQDRMAQALARWKG